MVVNAEAGAGRARSRWPRLEAELRRQGLAFDTRFTQGPGDATRLAAEAVRAGAYRAVVAVGGDGTVNEVVNGLLADRRPDQAVPVLGVLPSGTAQDFARSAGIPLGGRAAVRALAAVPHPVDVGRIRFASGRVRYFANYAGAGFDAVVAAQARAWGRIARGALPYVAGFFAVLHGYRNARFSVALDDVPLVPTRRVNMIIVANGPNYAGYLRIAPNASMDDGWLDVIVIGDVGRLELHASLPLALFGRHVDHPKVTAYRARRVTLAAARRVPVQSDGDVAGYLPAQFEILPGALQLLSPEPRPSALRAR